MDRECLPTIIINYEPLAKEQSGRSSVSSLAPERRGCAGKFPATGEGSEGRGFS